MQAKQLLAPLSLALLALAALPAAANAPFVSSPHVGFSARFVSPRFSLLPMPAVNQTFFNQHPFFVRLPNGVLVTQPNGFVLNQPHHFHHPNAFFGQPFGGTAFVAGSGLLFSDFANGFAGGTPTTIIINATPDQFAAAAQPKPEKKATVERTPEGVVVVRGPGTRH